MWVELISELGKFDQVTARVIELDPTILLVALHAPRHGDVVAAQMLYRMIQVIDGKCQAREAFARRR